MRQFMNDKQAHPIETRKCFHGISAFRPCHHSSLMTGLMIQAITFALRANEW
jgi:hypothetical protein